MAASDPIPDLLKAVNDASGKAFALWVRASGFLSETRSAARMAMQAGSGAHKLRFVCAECTRPVASVMRILILTMAVLFGGITYDFATENNLSHRDGRIGPRDTIAYITRA